MTRLWPVTVNRVLRIRTTFALLVGLMALPGVAYSDTASGVSFSISPKRCVTLRQGQPCFVRIRIEWQSSEMVKACVYADNGKQLTCWKAANGGRSVIAQTLAGTTAYVLADANGTELGRREVTVSWVYKKKRSNRRWRLF